MEARDLDGRRDPQAPARIESAWAEVRRRGGIEYDPASAEVRVACGPFTFAYVPGRARRPGAAGSGGTGLRRPHVPCPFEQPDLLELREAARYARDGRTYHIIANRFPVKSLHFLPLRPASEPADTLPQRIHCAAEIEDMLRLSRAFGPPWRFYFNSNTGADGSDSGSSINHWHFQVFPDPGDVLETAAIEVLDAPPRQGELAPGRLAGWPARHRAWRSDDLAALSRALHVEVERATALDIAFTLALRAEAGESVTAAFFARAPIAPIAIDGAGEISARFGGFELTGSVVVYDPAVLEWAARHPEQAAELARDRLVRATRDLWRA